MVPATRPSAAPAAIEAEAADLHLDEVTIEYTSGGYVVRPIEGLTLDVPSGELVLLLGASGCGKTTLLSALGAILTPARGTIRMGGVDVVGLSGRALTDYRRRQVGIVFQSFNLIPSLTAEENVAMPLRAGGVRRHEAMARAAELLGQVDLGDRAHHRPPDLSGGQAQRVAIARALAFDPPLVLADEPTAHLDYLQVEGVIRLLRDLARPGRLVGVATHDERLLPLADRVVELTPKAAGPAGPPTERALVAGERLFEQGEVGDRVYVVEAGEIEVLRRRADGGEDVLAQFGPGEYFGELAPTFGLRRSAGARARVDSVVVGYGVKDFRAHVGANATPSPADIGRESQSLG